MAVQQNKKSPSKRGMHRAHDFLTNPPLSFLVPALRRDFGGCAGNIAYAMRLLGGQPLPMATLGNDGGDYLERLRQLGIGTDFVRQIDDTYTTHEGDDAGGRGKRHQHEVQPEGRRVGRIREFVGLEERVSGRRPCGRRKRAWSKKGKIPAAFAISR